MLCEVVCGKSQAKELTGSPNRRGGSANLKKEGKRKAFR